MSKLVLTGVVEHGDGVALQDYDVPTANLSLRDLILIEPGVYAAQTQYQGKDYASVLCVGVGGQPKVEVHLFDFDETIYGEELTVEVIKKVSEFLPWQSKERMRQKIVHDLELVREVFEKKND